MSGVSIGYFDPKSFNPDVDYLTSRLKKAFPIQHKAWPLRVSSITSGGVGTGVGTGVAYAIVGGHIPIHIDSVGLQDSDGRIFQFVLEVENRPALMTAPAFVQNSPIILGLTDGFDTFGLGAMELKPGMAVHFDITTHFHGVTSLPVPMVSMKVEQPPRAVIIQVSGYGPDQIGEAIEHAVELIRLDRVTWDSTRAREVKH